MPIYEYVCEKCDNQFELLVFKDDEPECPKCGAKNLRKKMSAFGFSVGHKFTSSSSKGASCATCSSSNCSSCS